jgi:hypothetical protein
MDVNYEERNIDDPIAKDMMERIFSYPVYHPSEAHPNIVKHPDGHWIFILAFGMPDAGGDIAEFVNIALPIEVMDQMIPNMAQQLDHFHKSGGQTQRAN